MQFNEESLFPTRHDPLIITAVPLGRATPARATDAELAFAAARRVQLAMDCLKAGASMLHLDFPDSHAGESVSDPRQASALLKLLRRAAPKLILQMAGPALTRGCPAAVRSEREWASNVEQLEPKPHFMTMRVAAPLTTVAPAAVRIGGGRHDDVASAQLRLLRRSGIQPFFLLRDLTAHEALERLVRGGAYMGPLNECMMAASGGSIGSNPVDWVEFLRRAPAGSKIAFQGPPEVASPLAALAIALGAHIRVVAPDSSVLDQDATPDIVLQIRQVVRTARQLGRKVATCDDARRIMSVGTWYDSTDETLFGLGMLPSRHSGR